MVAAPYTSSLLRLHLLLHPLLPTPPPPSSYTMAKTGNIFSRKASTYNMGSRSSS